MSISTLEDQLLAAQARWYDILGGPLEEVIVAREALLSAERALSLAKGEETALACEWEFPWDTGAPIPHVVASGHKTYLIYALKPDPDPDRDRVFIRNVPTVRPPGSSDLVWDRLYDMFIPITASDEDTLALVEFVGCHAFKFGGPNVDVLNGHPLWHRGLRPYSAHVIAHSRWLAEAEKINQVHEYYNPEHWKRLKHYLLLFHDDTFECLARDYKIEVVRASLEQVSQIALARLFAWKPEPIKEDVHLARAETDDNEREGARDDNSTRTD